MDDVTQAANDVGMTAEQGETATGGVLSFLKDHLSEDHFKMIESYIPGAEEKVQAYARGASGSAGGFGGMLGSAMSSLGGGSSAGGLAGLMAILASKGISPAMVQQFLSKVGPMIQQKCGIDVTTLLGNVTATPASASTPDATPATPSAESTAEAAPTPAPAAASDAAQDLMGSAMGMFGK